MQGKLPSEASYQQARAAINATLSWQDAYASSACAWLQQRRASSGPAATVALLPWQGVSAQSAANGTSPIITDNELN